MARADTMARAGYRARFATIGGQFGSTGTRDSEQDVFTSIWHQTDQGRLFKTGILERRPAGRPYFVPDRPITAEDLAGPEPDVIDWEGC